MHLLCPTLIVFLVCSVQTAGLAAGYQCPLEGPRPKEASRCTPILDDEFAAWVEETGKSWGMKGLAVAITRKTKEGEWTTETKGYGVADRWGNPVDEESLFSIASNSKLFTALAVGTLVSNENVSIEWDTKIKDILPQSIWTLQDKSTAECANLIDILSHRTGLPRHDLSYGRGEAVESSVARLRYLRPSAEFREVMQYNNQMYMLASHIVSRLTSTPFTTYVARNIISPLGLSSTTYNVSHAKQSGKLTDSFVDARKDKKGKGHKSLRFWPAPFFTQDEYVDLNAGAGGVISSARDMATWLQTLLLSGNSPSTGDPVIPANAVDRVAQGVTIWRPAADFPELSPVVYGMGQMRGTYQGHELVEHGGDVPGQHSVLTRFPIDGLAVAVLTNWDYGAAFSQIVKWRLVEKALGLKEIDWNKRYHKFIDEAEAEKDRKKIPRSPDTFPSTIPYYDLAGLYFNPAYGTVFLCAYPPPKHPASSQKACEDLVSEAPLVLHPLLNDSVPTLLAISQKVWATHILLQHFSGDHFNASAAVAYAAPFPNASRPEDGSRPFAVEEQSWQAEFIVGKGPRAGPLIPKVEGMGWMGVWGAGDGVEGPKGEGREGAEVWFDRVA